MAMSASAPIELLFPPGLGDVGHWHPHLGMGYLQAALAGRGVLATQFLPPAGAGAAQVSDKILSRRPRVVGFSVYDSNLRACLNLANRIKSAQPSTWIVFGGPAPTLAWKWILRVHASVDLCVLGESEETGPALFEGLAEEPDKQRDVWPRLPGLAYRLDGHVVSTGLAPLAGAAGPADAPLDCLRSPYLSGVLTDGRSGVTTARGCTYGCVYCCFAALGRRSHRMHSPERVVDELTVLADHMRLRGDYYTVPIYDDTFGLHRARTREICEGIVQRGLRLKLSCLTRGDILDLETLQLMRRAGFSSLGLGLESAVPSVLRTIGKVRPPDSRLDGYEPELEYLARFQDTVRWAKSLGFVVGVSIMMGLPAETEVDGAKTVQFVEDLSVDHYMHNILRVVPGTPLWNSQERHGIASCDGTLGLPVTTRWPYDWSRIRPGRRSEVRARAANLRWRAITTLWSCGMPAADSRGLSVALVHANGLTTESANWLADTLGIGGLLFQVYTDSRLLAERGRLATDRETAIGAHIPYRRFLQVVPEGDDGPTRRWRILSELSDSLERHSPELLTLSAQTGDSPLESWAAARSRTADVWETLPPLLSCACRAQLEARVRSLPIGRLMFAQAPPPVMTYSGRWTDLKPPCLGLGRIEIDDRGALRVCRHGDALGTVGDPLTAIAERLEGLWRAAVERRALFCRTTNGVPGCPFPNLDDRSYCAMFDEQQPSLWRALDFLARAPGLLVELDAD
jgi:anaerobic magnesium-protoporphyrin IX monomethyl ester cyclase